MRDLIARLRLEMFSAPRVVGVYAGLEAWRYVMTEMPETRRARQMPAPGEPVTFFGFPFYLDLNLPLDVVEWRDEAARVVDTARSPQSSAGQPTTKLHGCAPSPEGAAHCIYCGGVL